MAGRRLSQVVPAKTRRGTEQPLRNDEDPLDLGDNEFFGFAVDAGMACFADAEMRDQLTDAWCELDDLIEPRCAVVCSGDMIVWSSGWGDGGYPTWIGRDTEGEVACFVADMLLFTNDADDPYEDDEDG